MRVIVASLGAMALLALVPACGGGAAVAPEEGEDLGSAASPQIDPMYGYMIAEAGVTVGAAWRGTISSGADVEYWVTLPAYSGSAARTFTATSESCSTWKRTVCGSSWSSASYYQGEFMETTLDCAFPPGPCAPQRGARSLLSSGSFRTSDALGSPFAWTYSTGVCEYWAMDHTISGTSTQSSLSPGYSSLSGFETAMCGMSTVPSTWFTSYYEALGNFCSDDNC